MEEEQHHTRSPLVATWNESPMSGLRKHSEKVYETMKPLKLALQAYVSGDMDGFKRNSELVKKLESEADEIKSAIRTHMPWAILMPVDKSFFLMTLHDEDGILDKAEDSVIWLSLRNTEIPEELRGELLSYFEVIDQTLKVYSEVVRLLHDMTESGFAKKDMKSLDDLVLSIHMLENKCDVKNRILTRKLFLMEGKMDTLAIYHIMKAVYIIGLIANQAENAAERIRAMVAK